MYNVHGEANPNWSNNNEYQILSSRVAWEGRWQARQTYAPLSAHLHICRPAHPLTHHQSVRWDFPIFSKFRRVFGDVRAQRRVVVEVTLAAVPLSRNVDEWVRSGGANRIHNAYRTWHPHPLADYLGGRRRSAPLLPRSHMWRGEERRVFSTVILEKVDRWVKHRKRKTHEFTTLNHFHSDGVYSSVLNRYLLRNRYVEVQKN